MSRSKTYARAARIHESTRQRAGSQMVLILSGLIFASGCTKPVVQEIQKKVGEKVADTVKQEVKDRLPEIQNAIVNSTTGVQPAMKQLEAEFQNALNRHGKWSADYTEWTTRVYSSRDSTKVLLTVFQPSLNLKIYPLSAEDTANGNAFGISFHPTQKSEVLFTGTKATGEDWAGRNNNRQWITNGYYGMAWNSGGLLCFYRKGWVYQRGAGSVAYNVDDFVNVFDSGIFSNFSHPDISESDFTARHAIQKCLAADHQLPQELEVAKKPFHMIAPEVAKRQKSLDFSGCPREFVLAFEKHTSAWSAADLAGTNSTFEDVKKVARKYGAGTIFY